MASNELEDLMSQLHVDSKLNFNTKDLGIPVPQPNGTNRMTKDVEKEYFRNGQKRRYPLPDNFKERAFDETAYYKPKFGLFCADDVGLYLPTLKVPIKDGRIDFKSLSKDQVISLFWNEHWKSKNMQDVYYRLKKNVAKRETRGLIVEKPHGSTTHGIKGGDQRSAGGSRSRIAGG